MTPHQLSSTGCGGGARGLPWGHGACPGGRGACPGGRGGLPWGRGACPGGGPSLGGLEARQPTQPVQFSAGPRQPTQPVQFSTGPAHVQPLTQVPAKQALSGNQEGRVGASWSSALWKGLGRGLGAPPGAGGWPSRTPCTLLHRLQPRQEITVKELKKNACNRFHTHLLPAN